MAETADNQLAFRPLYGSSVLNIFDYQCSAGRGGPAAEEYAEANQIVLMRQGTFCRHFGRSRSISADVNRTIFFSQGSSYRVSHPSDCGDRGTVIALSQEVLSEIMLEVNPALANPAQPFPFATGPCSARTFMQHRWIIEKLERNCSATAYDGLLIEESVIQLVRAVLEDAFAFTRDSFKKYRSSTRSTHGEQVEAAKSYMADHVGEQIKLEDIARSIHLSPFHLSRIFRQHTGLTLHNYLSQLRLRLSIERLFLPEGKSDLSQLAFDLGFSSHSHFSDSFQREFQCTPSQFRQDTQRLLKASKILKA